MKKIVLLLALVLCLGVSGCAQTANPYAAFDPEGAIAGKYIGMNVSQLQKADNTLRYEGDKSYVAYSKSIGRNATFSCQITNGAVDGAAYIYVFDTVDRQVADYIKWYNIIRPILGAVQTEPEELRGHVDATTITASLGSKKAVYAVWGTQEGFRVQLFLTTERETRIYIVQNKT